MLAPAPPGSNEDDAELIENWRDALLSGDRLPRFGSVSRRYRPVTTWLTGNARYAAVDWGCWEDDAGLELACGVLVPDLELLDGDEAADGMEDIECGRRAVTLVS